MSRVVEGRRNRCTRQRDANHRGYSSFFLSPPLLFFFSFHELSRSSCHSLSLPSLSPLSLRYHCPISRLLSLQRLPVAGGFRSDVGTIEKSIRTGRSYPRCRYCRVAPFLRFLFFDLLFYRRMIDDGFTISYVTGSDKCTYTHSKMLN